MAPPRTLVIVLAGGAGSRLELLTKHRAKPAMRFAGTHRLVDFPLSNARNAGIDDVWVVQQFHPTSLNVHLANGRPWDLDRTRGGLLVLEPYQGDEREGWHAGTADALWRFAPAIEGFGADAVVVVSADAIYRLDYAAVVDEHLASDAEVTMVTVQHDGDNTRYGVVETKDGRITGYQLKPDEPATDVVTTEVFVFDPQALVAGLETVAEQGEDALTDLGEALLPLFVERGTAHDYRHTGYWQDVGTVAAYWRTNVAFARADAPFDVDDEAWPISTRGARRGGARVSGGGEVESSLLGPGARIEGRVRGSVIGPGVHIHAGAEVVDSVIIDGAVVGAGARVVRAIVDERARIADGVTVGVGAEGSEDDDAITLVGAGAEVDGDLSAGARHPEQ
ncbi:glucose-1-phosphate adenylyltransferase family protein [Georgenia faecalis]|uniref:glucose-1-phosphate adenylyltransferase family protein n=1 Tax=Georgenia faecalis TaxID=2483799 RepID=UPI000FD85E6F|nr:sugar phosphate nucleotidyltransferase [Georgenia faecalis]